MKKLLLIILLFFSVNNLHAQRACGSCIWDSDEDGIIDCFDRCPDTKLNCPVDSHGCPKDTDGDGVADYLDQQLITPTECQPSDEKGIGFCPTPTCCPVAKMVCADFGYKKYSFTSGKIIFDDYVIKMLDNLANSMKANPSFKVVIAIYGTDIALINYEKLKSKIISYLGVEKGIDIERLIFQMSVTNTQPYIEIRNPKDDGK